MASVGATRVRADSATGQTTQPKKSDYASGGPHKSVVGSKIGKVTGHGYSGPNVARAGSKEL